MEIRSYRTVFDLERRVYSVDRLRLNPGGVPVRGIAYCLALVAASLITRRLPLLGALQRGLPWYLGDLALPLTCAAVMTAIRVEGRTFHLAALAVARHRIGPRRLVGLTWAGSEGDRWHPQELLVMPDGSDSVARRLRYRGPGAVLVAIDHVRTGGTRERHSIGLAPRFGRRTVTVSESPCGGPLREGQVIALAGGSRLRVRAR